MGQMVKRILEQEAIHFVLSSDHKTAHLLPTWQDIEVLQAIDNDPSPLSSLTFFLLDLYVTVSAVIQCSSLLKRGFLFTIRTSVYNRR